MSKTSAVFFYWTTQYLLALVNYKLQLMLFCEILLLIYFPHLSILFVTGTWQI